MGAGIAIEGAAAAMVAAPSPRRPATVADAAKQFEALLIRQMLEAARGGESGWLGSGEETGNSIAAGLAEEQFAQALAHSGGLGLSERIAASFPEEPWGPGGL